MVFLLLALFYKKEKWKKIFRWTSLGMILLFSNSFIFLELCRMWEVPGKNIKAVEHYDVGIVLTGMAEYNTTTKTLSIRRQADRIWQAVNLYHEKKIDKILITGDHGYVSDRGLHEAIQLKKVLVHWKIPSTDVITERSSRNTHENAVETKKILDRSYPHLKKKLLITSGTHMRRSLACFSKIGVKCDPFSTDLRSGSGGSYYWDQYIIPNIGTITDWNVLTKEWFGYLVYKIVGYV